MITAFLIPVVVMAAIAAWLLAKPFKIMWGNTSSLSMPLRFAARSLLTLGVVVFSAACLLVIGPSAVPIGFLLGFVVALLWFTIKAFKRARNTTAKMRKPTKYAVRSLLIVGIIFLTVLCLRPVIPIVVFLVNDRRLFRERITKLQSPPVYEPVADRLILYCQSEQSFFPKELEPAWFPEELTRVIHAGWGSVSSNGGCIVYRDFGSYNLVLETNGPESISIETNYPSPSRTNIWHLYFDKEDRKELLLQTRRVPANYALSADQLLDTVLPGYDRLQAADPTDDHPKKARITLLLHLGRIREAQSACQKWAASSPDDYLPRFTLAHVRARLGEIDAASAEFAAWVDSHKDFSNYNYLFFFNMREGRREEALNAIRKALDQPCGGSHCFLGEDAAVFAFEQGDYRLCIGMCDKMLADSEEDKYWKGKLWKQRAAAAYMNGWEDQALEDMKRSLSYAEREHPPSTFGEENKTRDSRLVAAITQHDKKFIQNYQNWKDVLDTWYSPYDNEIGMNYDTNMPSLYPAAWDQQSASRE